MREIIKNSNFHWNEISNGSNAYSKDLITSSYWENVSFHHVLVKAGGEIEIHIHEKQDEAHFVISGKGIGIVSGQEIVIEIGDVMFVNNKIIHGVKNNTDNDLLLLCVFNPPLS